MCVHVRVCRHVCVDLKQTARGDIHLHTYMYSYIHIFAYTYLCREDSAAVQRSVEVECPTRQVTQEYTLLVCIIVCPHVYARPYLVCKRGIRAVRQERRHRARQAVFTGLV